MKAPAILLALALTASAGPAVAIPAFTPSSSFAKDVCSERDSPAACLRDARARYRELYRQGYTRCVAASLAEMPDASPNEVLAVVWLCGGGRRP